MDIDYWNIILIMFDILDIHVEISTVKDVINFTKLSKTSTIVCYQTVPRVL